LIYVSFGHEKGGSTLTALLTKALLERAGHPHMPFSAEARNDIRANGTFNRHGELINNVNEWSQEVVETLVREVPADRIVMFRTHAAPSEAVQCAAESGVATCQVAIRDLRDVALSWLDTTAVKLKKGRTDLRGMELGEVASTFPVMRENVESTYRWLDMPGAIVLEYEETAFRPEVSIRKICRQLGIDFPEREYDELFAKAASNPSGKRNVAIPRRHVREMTAEDQALILQHFADFYRLFYPRAAVAVLGD
jgi:hypothetical protein